MRKLFRQWCKDCKGFLSLVRIGSTTQNCLISIANSASAANQLSIGGLVGVTIRRCLNFLFNMKVDLLPHQQVYPDLFDPKLQEQVIVILNYLSCC